MPIRNEADDLERAVASILAQDYPSRSTSVSPLRPRRTTPRRSPPLWPNEPRVSSSPTRPASRRPASTPRSLRPPATSSYASTDTPTVGRVHRRAVETMCRTGAVNVGGVQAALGETPFEQAVATAMTSWMGTGGSRFHVGGASGPVDTVYLGVFDRAAGAAVGWFDESLIRNQDYELNIRLRQPVEPSGSTPSSRCRTDREAPLGHWPSSTSNTAGGRPRCSPSPEIAPSPSVPACRHRDRPRRWMRHSDPHRSRSQPCSSGGLHHRAGRCRCPHGRGYQQGTSCLFGRLDHAPGLGRRRRVRLRPAPRKPAIGLQQTVRSADSSRHRC